MASAHVILLAVDDPALQQTLAEHLAAAGHCVVGRPGAMPAELAVIDDRWPDAATLCRDLKQGGAMVVMLGDAVAGADAAVPRPLRLGTLMGKVSQLLARAGAAPRAVRLGRWRFDAAARILEDSAGDRVRLTDKEAAILAFLAEADGIVARERLLAGVWGYSAAIATHTLETHIYRLRRKLERDPARAEILLTEDGGYRLARS